MEDKAKSLFMINYSDIPGIDTMRSVGMVLLTIALFVHMIVQMYKFVSTGKADFLTPILKIGIAMLIMNSLEAIGSYLSEAIAYTCEVMLNKNVLKMASDSWAAAFSGVSDPGALDYIEALFSPTSWLCIMTYLGLIAIVLIKMVIIDVIFPIMLGVVIITGAISVPIGVFPGVNTFKGWFMNLIEIWIWPLVFQLLTTMLFATFSAQLQDVNKDSMTELRQSYDDIQLKMELDEFHADMSWRDVDNYSGYKEAQEKSDKLFYKFVKFLGIVAAYGVICLFTPFLARIIVRSESAGVIGGIMAAMATKLVTAPAKSFARMFRRRTTKVVHVHKVSGGNGKTTEKKSPTQRLNERKASLGA
jgi:hypothetical protein